MGAGTNLVPLDGVLPSRYPLFTPIGFRNAYRTTIPNYLGDREVLVTFVEYPLVLG